ncbi:IGSF1 protein, partial [Nothocercus nigrocapillus]|nr:IGSF1 protein [Nothocercus nigrocapillus]
SEVLPELWGWCPAHCSFPAPVPRPSLSLHPSQEVVLGDMVTLRCRVPRSGVWVSIYKEEDEKCQWQCGWEKDMVEVSVHVSTWNFAGRYRCQYENISFQTLDVSSPVELVVLGERLPETRVLLGPGGRVKTGTTVTISCESTYGATFILHKSGSSAPIQLQRLDVKNTATFTLPSVTQSDVGIYGCSYRPQKNSFISSHPRSEVTLELEP